MKCSILGCGWLGLPLAKFLKEQNIDVSGSTTSAEKISELKNIGVTPFLLKIENNTIFGAIEEFLQSEILFINIPFGQQKENFEAYKKLALLIEASSIQKVIFISSTSVYSDSNAVVTEDENFEVNPPKQILVDLEHLFLKNPHFKTTVLRFSGLIGGSRNPANFFKEGRLVKNGAAPINLIHLDDCIQIVYKLLQSDVWNTVLNASADTHPTRKEFYTAATLHAGKIPATFLEETTSFKIISNEKLKRVLNYEFIHGDLLKMIPQF
ncbi:Rossmann-fold NAD(P)-binding domain-containing protein [Flavicella sediminum]|uniref:hypothetical protein n=1 Tax=Flavicella sediminum TaxID=2585141 RepID=UPI0011233264|nr:hypothetical protein [Flavicella sediminum]